ncbi:phage virion morphogenesis protein [Aggregatibacter actinomycetemcomitans]|uniref:phage virion morphogenesis protein n=1 Tax=Aggregatibacter actinomycetemcomitans TaxID=714 RepID=UPI00197C3B90|nr:phage virion morphogenesis protein [Aggregatibacter actinomycetemcomitans]MBN6064190.1 phage virion morphogenesis protein [Aggregatibacter actinomycetemcomitans]MBN6081267.1 phage virion morphogenesis protein [Aggregatibacter actinomycetemcomitans]MBN6084033.1 phage virion morphogenesis protein [Aggregatibacter actinomycetemcomitans]
MATVEQIQAKLTALINNLSPQARRQLARNIGQALRKSQQARIARQQNPDGTAFEPRKRQKQFGKKKGRIKRQAMFVKLRTAKYLKVRSNANEVTVGFSGVSAAIANIHQYGLSAKPTPSSNYKVKYAQRELLGFSDQDLDVIEILILEQLAR